MRGRTAGVVASTVVAFAATMTLGLLDAGGDSLDLRRLADAPTVMVDRLPHYAGVALVVLAAWVVGLIACRRFLLGRSLWATTALAVGGGVTAPFLFVQQLGWMQTEVGASSVSGGIASVLQFLVGPALILTGLCRIGFAWSDPTHPLSQSSSQHEPTPTTTQADSSPSAHPPGAAMLNIQAMPHGSTSSP